MTSSDTEPRIADFSTLLRRVRAVGAAVAALTAVVVVVDALLRGPSAVAVLQWATAGAALVLSVSTVLALLHALGGMDTAQKRGERLSGDDVRLRPLVRRPLASARAARRTDPQDPGVRSGSPSNDDDGSA
jgi:hypothetical protein